MRLYTERGEFTLPEDFSLEMQLKSPVFTSEGSASATFSLPASNENLEAAGRPDRISRQFPFVNHLECILQLGTFQIQGTLIITSCSKQSIGCCYTYNEGSLYADYKDESLKEILKYATYYRSTVNLGILASYMQEHMEDSDLATNQLAVFPVKLQLMDGLDICMNELEDQSDESGISYGDIIYKARSYTKGDTTINVPEGYGLTAFPFLCNIIEVILDNIGYSVVRNDFTKEPYKHLVLLHPVADLMCKGNIAFKDFVPDIKLSAFISWLQDKFGAYIYADNRNASIVILDELLSETPSLDLTPYINDDLSMEIPDSEHISIEMDTSLAPTPTDTDTYDNFIKKYGSIQEVLTIPANTAGVYLHTPTGRLYQVVKSGASYNQEFLGYNNFPYKGQYWNSADVAKKTTDKALGCDIYKTYTPSPLLLHVGTAAHYNTAIKGEEEKVDHPLMVAWAYYDGHYWRGSVTGIESNGTVLYPSLNPEGIFRRFWQKYNTVKLNLAPSASVTVDIPYDAMKNFDLAIPVLISHNRAIIKNISLKISNNGIATGQLDLMMLPNIQNPNEV